MLEQQLRIAKEQIEILPKGTLRCTSSNGSDQYHINGEYISKKKRDYARKVAQREYDEKLVPLLEKVISKWEDLEFVYDNCVLENQFETMCNARKALVTPLIEPIEIKIERFMKEEYEPSTFGDDDKTELYTLQNERVRSKSELIIADELFRYGIPYRYEMPIELESRGKIVIFRPDFTVMNRRNGKKYIMEHLGMMDNPEYVERNIEKMDVYERNGILLGVNLLLTHETSKIPLCRNVLDSYIENYFI